MVAESGVWTFDEGDSEAWSLHLELEYLKG